jgi:dihydrofolate reductase
MKRIKTTLIILQSLDGYIAKYQDDSLDWGSAADKEHFRSLSKQIGVMIIGSNTYRKMPETAFNERFNLVLTSNPGNYNEKENIVFKDLTPDKALEYLTDLGYKQAAIVGGGKINNSFLHRGLVDEIYVTIGPKIFASGIPSFGENKIDKNLTLLDYKKISQNELLLHYKVIN